MSENRFLLRLKQDSPIICAEGYLFELERRGYVQIGPFVPEVVLSDPQAVKQLHREFVRAGSEVVEAFTYYGHRAKLRLIGKEHLLEELQRTALRIAREVINEFPDQELFLAGNISNTTIYNEEDQNTIEQCREMFREQVKWAKEANVDFIIGETFSVLGEALLALKVIKEFQVPAVITMAFHQLKTTTEGHSVLETLLALEKAGADVVGINCSFGPKISLSVLSEAFGKVTVPIACLPVGYNTTEEKLTMQSLTPDRDKKYTDLDGHTCTRYDFAEFATEATKLGVKYLGTCCGGAPHHVRAIAEALGRHPIASKFSADLSLHFAFGNKEVVSANTDEKTIAKNFNYGDNM